MVKLSFVNKNEWCKQFVKKYVVKYVVLKVQVDDELFDDIECLIVCLKLVEIFCNGNLIWVCNCCVIIGCLCGYYCKFGFCCVEFCDFVNKGMILGVMKLSW